MTRDRYYTLAAATLAARNFMIAGTALGIREEVLPQQQERLPEVIGWYLTRVLDVKRSHTEAFAVAAGGTHHLRTPAAKDHDQPCAVISVPDCPRRGPVRACPPRP